MFHCSLQGSLAMPLNTHMGLMKTIYKAKDPPWGQSNVMLYSRDPHDWILIFTSVSKNKVRSQRPTTVSNRYLFDCSLQHNLVIYYLLKLVWIDEDHPLKPKPIVESKQTLATLFERKSHYDQHSRWVDENNI